MGEENVVEKTADKVADNMAAPLPAAVPQGETTTEKTTGTPASLSDHDSNDAEKADGTPVVPTSPRNVHGVKWALAVFSILVSTFLFALDNTIVADIQPAIVNRFGEVGKLSWLAVAFLIAAIGTNLFWYAAVLGNL